MAASNVTITADPIARPVPMLTKDERIKIVKNLGPKVQPLVFSVVNVFKLNASRNEWKKFRGGVLCFVYDTVSESYFFRLYTQKIRPPPNIFNKKQVKPTWNFKIKPGLTYHQVEDYFGTFQQDKSTWGFLFVVESEASFFGDIVIQQLGYPEELGSDTENTDTQSEEKIVSPVTSVSYKPGVKVRKGKPKQEIQDEYNGTTGASRNPSLKACTSRTNFFSSKLRKRTSVNFTEEIQKLALPNSEIICLTKMDIWSLSSNYKKWIRPVSVIFCLEEENGAVILTVRHPREMEKILLQTDLCSLRYDILGEDFVALKLEDGWYGFDFKREENNAFEVLKDIITSTVIKPLERSLSFETTDLSTSLQSLGLENYKDLDSLLFDDSVLPLRADLPDLESSTESEWPAPLINLESTKNPESSPNHLYSLSPSRIDFLESPDESGNSLFDDSMLPSIDATKLQRLKKSDLRSTLRSPCNISFPTSPAPMNFGSANSKKFIKGSQKVSPQNTSLLTNSLLHDIRTRRTTLRKAPASKERTPKTSHELYTVLQRRMKARLMSSAGSEDSNGFTSHDWEN